MVGISRVMDTTNRRLSSRKIILRTEGVLRVAIGEDSARKRHVAPRQLYGPGSKVPCHHYGLACEKSEQFWCASVLAPALSLRMNPICVHHLDRLRMTP